MSQTKAQLIDAVDGSIVDADIAGLSSSKLSGNLPAISAASLTNIPAANLTGTLPAISGANLTNIDGGKILKVYSVTSTTGQDITSSSYVDITNLTLTLTPAATSKCLVHAVVSGYAEFTSTYHGFNKMQVLRDSTAIGVDQRNIRLQTHSSTDYLQVGCPLVQTILDTHGADGSTAVTYKCQGQTNHGHMYVNSSYNTYSYLTVYEVAPN